MTVVVGFDGSDESMDALQFAATEARLRGTSLRIVSTFKIPDADWLVAGGGADPHPHQERAQRLVDDALAAVGHDLEGVDVESVVSLGNPAQVLLANASKDDIVVVGSRGRGGFKGLLLGSVSQQVVLHALGPVVVVRGASGETPRSSRGAEPS